MLFYQSPRIILFLQKAGMVILSSGLALFILLPWIPFLNATPPRTIIVYGFSILGEVMNDAIFPAFQEEWRAQTGEQIEFISAFAGSGTITNQIILGVPAEVAILSLELDAQRLQDKNIVPGATWRDLPHQGILNRTPFIILVRSGNPKYINDFNDLTRTGIGIVHPDPLTSGGAQWALLAEYGSVLQRGGTPQQAQAQLTGIWHNVIAQASSARATRSQFENGFGDALITYEQEALRDRQLGRLKLDLVYPQSTILSEHTVVVIDKNIESSQRDLVYAFVNFLWSEKAQSLFAEYGFRSVNENINQSNPYFGTIAYPFYVGDMGGWRKAKKEIVDDIWKKQVLPEIEK